MRLVEESAFLNFAVLFELVLFIISARDRSLFSGRPNRLIVCSLAPPRFSLLFVSFHVIVSASLSDLFPPNLAARISTPPPS